MYLWRAKDEYQRAKLIEDIRSMPLPFQVELVQGDDRSLAQNRTSWKWFTEIGKSEGMTAEEVHRDCKAYVGVPILIRDNQDFAETYNRCIRPLPTETKLEAMDLIDVTKIMTTRQMAEFMEGVRNRYPHVELTEP